MQFKIILNIIATDLFDHLTGFWISVGLGVITMTVSTIPKLNPIVNNINFSLVIDITHCLNF